MIKNSMFFDESLIGRMLNETFENPMQLGSTNQSVSQFVKILEENGVSYWSIVEYTAFWRVDFQNGPIDFPINWGLIKDAKQLLAANKIIFVSAESDFQCLCKIFKTDILGIYKDGGKSYFFSVQRPNSIFTQYLKSNAHEITEPSKSTMDTLLPAAA